MYARNFVEGTPGNVLKKELGQSDHFPRSLSDFARKIAYRKSRRQIGENGGFRAEKWPIFARFQFFLEFDRNHWNTPLVQKWGHLGHFWPFYGHLKSRFWPFSLIYKHREDRPCKPHLPSRFGLWSLSRRFFI